MDATIPGNGVAASPKQELVRVEARFDDSRYAESLYEHLERGNLLLLQAGDSPYLPTEDDQAFLRAQPWQTDGSAHKNIAYKPHLKATTGFADNTNPADAERLNRVLRAYSEGALGFLGRLLPRYGAAWIVDYATLRGMEEAGRDLPTKKRNDLMHVDAFPTRPTHGGRILRAFTNINQSRSRVWACAEPFPELAAHHAVDAGLNKVRGAGLAAKRAMAAATRLVGIKAPDRSAYDEFMLGFHDYLKQNESFQSTEWENVHAFPPGSTWVSFTDGVAHKVISGQYAIEQTCIVPLSAMQRPEWAPVRVLEGIARKPLI